MTPCHTRLTNSHARAAQRVEMAPGPVNSGESVWGTIAQTAATHIWRIENMKPVKQPNSASGKFCTGDSYIVLHIFEARSQSPRPFFVLDVICAVAELGSLPCCRQVKGSIRMNVHFWLGTESTQDERGAAVRSSISPNEAARGDPFNSSVVHHAERSCGAPLRLPNKKQFTNLAACCRRS